MISPWCVNFSIVRKPASCQPMREHVMSHSNPDRPVKYIFVTGGVVSSLGKGLAAASIGCLLEGHGYKVALQKFDPYITSIRGR